MTSLHKIILACTILPAALSCSKDVTPLELPEEGTEGGQSITCLSLSAQMNADTLPTQVAVDSSRVVGGSFASIMKRSVENIESPLTKGSPLEDLTTYGSFSLYGYLYDSWSASCRANWMFGERVTYSSGTWTTDNMFNTHLGSRKMRVYAIAPHDAAGVYVDPSTGGPLGFSYTVPADVESQKDLLCGASAEYTGTLSDLAVSFSHCLSAITFRTGKETVDGTIKSITLKGVYSKGDYVAGSGWSNLSTKSDFAFSSDIAVSEGTSKELTGGSSTMMLLPQTVPSDAVVEIVIESGGSTHTLSASIAGDSWTEGRRCVYSLSFDSIAGMKISLDIESLTLEWGEYRDITVTGDPSDQEWTNTITGTGLSTQKISSSVLRITNNNISGEDSDGNLTVTTEDERRSASASVKAKSLQESITLSPASSTIAYGSSATITASGTYPNGYSLSSPTGTTISKDGNTISVKNTTSSYTATDVTLTATTALMGRSASASIHLSAKPETIKFDKTTLTIGSSGAGTVTASGSYDSFTAALSSTTYATLSQEGNTLTITNKNTTYESQTVTLTITTAGDTKATATCTITLSPMEDYVIDYEISPVSLSSSSVGAGGGTITVNGCSVTQKWVSGKSVANYADAVISVQRSTLESSYPASVSGKSITVSSLGTSTVAQGTYTVTASFSSGGITATSKTAQFTQSENKLENSNYNPSGYTAYASLGSGLAASGGTATLSYYACHSAYNLYSSGASDSYVHTVYDQASVSISSNGNGAFSLSGTTTGSAVSNTCTVSHSDMTTNERTDLVTVRVTNASSTANYREASTSVTNSRHTGTLYTKDHTKTGSVTYGSKSYGATVYGTKVYGSEYLKSTDYGTLIQDEDTFGSWTTYGTETEKYSYSVSFAVSSWTPDADASSISNAVTASHYEREKYSQRRTVTYNFHQSYTQHYYRDYTRSASRSYTRTASQSCTYTEYRTDTFDSGSTLYVEESRCHTETWTDSGTEALANDSGSEWYRDSSGTSYSTSDGGYGYQTTYGTASKKSDSVTPSSSQSFLSWSSGTMSVSQNTLTSSRSATLTATNGSSCASCPVTQQGAQYSIDIL